MSIKIGVIAVSSLTALALNAYAVLEEGTIKDQVTGEYTNVVRDFQEGVVLNPQTGDYTVTYKSADESFNEVVFIPATKILPTFKSKFETSKSGNTVSYRYTIKNGRDAKQDIGLVQTEISNIVPGGQLDPSGWESTVVPALKGSDLILSWSPYLGGTDKLRGLPPGRTQNGFVLKSNDLPGIAIIRARGITGGVTEWLGHYPVGSVGRQMDEIEKKDFIPVYAAVPRIPVTNPINIEKVLQGIQQHLHQDLLSMKLVDSALSAQLDRSLIAAIEGAKIDNTAAVKSNLKDIRHLLKKEHNDIEKDDDGAEDDSHKTNVKNKSQVIDKLAAKVLDFDVKYVLKRLEE